MLHVNYTIEAQEHLFYWASNDPKFLTKIIRLIESVSKNPFDGIGKPEPLKHNLSGYWSRRIDDKNRIIYRVLDKEVVIISCKGHYNPEP